MIHQRHRQTDRQTDGQTTCDCKMALFTIVHRGVKTIKVINTSHGTCSRSCNVRTVIFNGTNHRRLKKSYVTYRIAQLLLSHLRQFKHFKIIGLYFGKQSTYGCDKFTYESRCERSLQLTSSLFHITKLKSSLKVT